jgi:hypothetical protein
MKNIFCLNRFFANPKDWLTIATAIASPIGSSMRRPMTKCDHQNELTTLMLVCRSRTHPPDDITNIVRNKQGT